MRVLQIAYSHPLSDARVLRYVDCLQQRGHTVDVVALRRPGEEYFERAGNVSFWRLQERRSSETKVATYLLRTVWFCLKAARLVRRQHQRQRFDLVHVHNLPDYLVWSARALRRFGCPLIFDVHDLSPELYGSRFGGANGGLAVRALYEVERRCLADADHVIVANDIWRNRLIERAVPAARCTTLLNYPDTRLFRPEEEKTRSRENFVILYPGSFQRHQGLAVALRAFARAAGRMPGAKFHLYGKGPDENQLCRLVAELGLEARVEFHRPVPLRRLAAVMRTADLGVIPKLAEGFGGEAFSTKSLEFMACGVPVVMTRTPVDSYYFNEELVRFFPSGDVEALAQILVDEYQNREVARRRAARALEFVRRENWENRQQIYLDLVAQLTGQPV